MKQETKRWLARIVFVALVALGTLAAGPRYAAAQAGCPDFSVGTCPPLTPYPDMGPGSCWKACQDSLNASGGYCQQASGCCLCVF